MSTSSNWGVAVVAGVSGALAALGLLAVTRPPERDLEDRLKGHEGKLNGHEGKLNGHEGKLKGHESAIARLIDQVAMVDKSVHSLARYSDQTDLQIERLKSAIADLEASSG